MSRETIRPQQFAHADNLALTAIAPLSADQSKELSSLYETIFGDYKQGSLTSGKVVSVSSDGVLVDINFKSNGLIPLYEFSEQELRQLTPGSQIEVIIDELESVEGTVILSHEKAKAHRAWATIMKLFEENKPIEGTVTHKVKGGLSVDIGGVSAFLPGSQVDVQRVADFDIFLKQPITAFIIKVNPKRGNVIISRRKYLSEQRADSRKKIMETLHVGSVIQGVVKNITNYGAFVDIGGVDGLLHITDMRWGRIGHPSEILKIGDTVTVKILTLDAVNEKISLGMKQLQGNPWENLSKEVTIGSVVRGTVSSIADYGLFVTVADGVEGLVHISEISWTERITDLHKQYKVGDPIEALVVSLDVENRRMSLSIKQLGKNPWDLVTEQLNIGQKITGTVTNVVDFGVFVQVMPGIDGLIHIADFSWTEHVKHPSDLFKKGDRIEAVITDINTQKKKISLGLKQLQANPWDLIEERYPLNSIVEGEVTKITDFGAFVKLPDGIEGLVHISEIGEDTHSLQDTLQVGQTVKLRVIKVSKDEQKLGLSLRLQASARHEGGQKRSDRGDRGDRGSDGQRPKRGERSEGKKHHDQGSFTSNVFGEKLKSHLQLELEKHAHRASKQNAQDDES